MADVVVTIKKNGAGCTIAPDPFEATKNADVTFVFDGESNGFVDFGAESPFGDATDDIKFPPGQKKVKATARPRPFKYKYRVSWPGGQGNGSGEIIP